MNEKLPILNVHMLGDFSVMYGDQPISFGKNTTTKAMKLLTDSFVSWGTGHFQRKTAETHCMYGKNWQMPRTTFVLQFIV